MKYLLILISIFMHTSVFGQSEVNVKNYVDTKDATLKDAYPKTYDKVMPGCLTAEQLIKLKIFLKEKWLVDLEDLKTLNFYYAKNEKNINM